MKKTVAFIAVLCASAVAAQTAKPSSRSVKVKDGLVDVQATDAKLPDLLAELTKLAGIPLTYDAQAPKPLVTISFQGKPLNDALNEILVAGGVRFVVTQDPSGKRPVAVMVMPAEGAPGALSPEEWVKKHVKPGQPAPAAPGTTTLPPGMTMTDPSKVGSPPKPSGASPKPGESQPLPPGMRPAGDPPPGSKPPDPSILLKPASPAASPAAKPTPSPSPTPGT
jgi:hypothetical protein